MSSLQRGLPYPAGGDSGKCHAEVKNLGWNPTLPFLATELWKSYLIFLCISFLIGKAGMLRGETTPPDFRKAYRKH